MFSGSYFLSGSIISPTALRGIQGGGIVVDEGVWSRVDMPEGFDTGIA
jgi:hypothetical protein